MLKIFLFFSSLFLLFLGMKGKALLDAFGFPFRKGEMPASTKKSRGAAKRSLKK